MIIGMQIISVPSQVWISSLEEHSDDAEVEMAAGAASAEITDLDGDGEVAVHFTLADESQALVSIYMTRANALALGSLLGHEAVKTQL